MRVLITGTTSGLGRAFAAHYSQNGHDVIPVNRRDLDISQYDEVLALLRSLQAADRTPDLFILNAGINRPDNLSRFDYSTFDLVMKTNLNGVLTFVGAIRELGLRGKTLATISSTSNLVPNPGHVGYYLSKLALKHAFRLLQRNDPSNQYRVVVLGPVLTNIASGYPKAKGIAGKIFDVLAIEPDVAAKAIAKFFEGSRWIFSYPKRAAIFYFAARCVLFFFPGLYSGTPPSFSGSIKISSPLQH